MAEYTLGYTHHGADMLALGSEKETWNEKFLVGTRTAADGMSMIVCHEEMGTAVDGTYHCDIRGDQPRLEDRPRRPSTGEGSAVSRHHFVLFS
jgi:hypothetical protein